MGQAVRPRPDDRSAAPARTGAVRSPHRFVHLLAAQLGLILVYPFVVEDRPMPAVAACFLLAIFVATLWVVAGDRRIRIVATLLVIPTVVGNLLSAAAPDRYPLLPAVAFGTVFLGFMTVVIFRGVVQSPAVTTETLYGAVTAYMLLGITWAQGYLLVEMLHPGAFRSASAADGRVVPPDLTFLSFITLTSVGYGDIVPVSRHARALAILEAVAGQMYLAVFVARLVGMHGQHPRERG